MEQRINDFDKALKKALKAVKKGGKGAGFPQYRSKHLEHHQTLRLPHNWTKKAKRGEITPTQCSVQILKMPCPIRWTKHRPLEGRLKFVTIKRENNRWFAVCLCELEDIPYIPPTSEAEVTGIDMGLNPTIARYSDGTKFDTQKFFRREEKKLARVQRVLSRKKKGSANRQKAKRKVNTVHYRIKCRRKNYVHWTTTSIAKRVRFIGVESLNIAGMMKDRRQAKSVADQAMGQFLELLPYKVEGRGGVSRRPLLCLLAAMFNAGV